jgi:riboflavin kinase
MNKIKGLVVTGQGIGQYYISREGYRKQFIQKLGFDPIYGTLNLKLTEPFIRGDTSSIEIEGFSDEGRTFGACRCFPAKICGVKCAIVQPERSDYPPNLVEIIAPVQLRKTLNLKDGDILEVILE